jgi:drug/metabolite transporter (DMT)-like permease
MTRGAAAVSRAAMALPDPIPDAAVRSATPLPAIVIRLISAVLITAMFACVKIASTRGVHVLESVFYRQLTGVLVLIPIALSGPGLAALRTDRPWAHVSRMVIGMIAMSLNFLSFALLPIAEATAIGFMVPIVATLLSIVLLHESVGVHRWSAIAVGLVGVLIVVQPGDGHIPLTGAVVSLSGVAITAFVSIIIRKLGETENPVTTMFWFSLSSMVPLGIAMLFVGQMHDAQTWGIIALMGLFGAGAQLGITWSLRLAPVSVVLPMDYSSLIWAALIGYLIWDSWPVPATWIGAPLIIGSGLYIALRENRLAREAAQATARSRPSQ